MQQIRSYKIQSYPGFHDQKIPKAVFIVFTTVLISQDYHSRMSCSLNLCQPTVREEIVEYCGRLLDIVLVNKIRDSNSIEVATDVKIET